MNIDNEVSRMAVITNIQLICEKLNKVPVPYKWFAEKTNDQLRLIRDELIVEYNSVMDAENRLIRPDGCIIEKDGTIKSDVIWKEGEEY